MGVCASLLGQGPRAWEAYIAAALAIPEGDVAVGLADTLSQAGLLRVTNPSALPSEAEVDEELVARAFDDLVGEARRCLLGEAPPTYAAAMRPHRAFTGLMVLAAHAGLELELLRASRALLHDVAAPFVVRHDVRRSDSRDEPPMVAAAFEGLARLCEAVAARERGRRARREPVPFEVGLLTGHVGRAFVGEPHALMSRWLVTYLRERHGAVWVTDELLRTAGTP